MADRRRLLVVGAAVIAVLALSLPLVWQHWKEPPMMTYQQAVDEVERLVLANTGHLTPPPRLESDRPVLKTPCSGPNDDQRTGTVMVEHTYWLRDVDPSLNDSIVDQLRRYWADHDYRVVLDRGSSGNRKVVAKNPENGFRVYITEGQRVLSLGAQSNCVPKPSD